MQRYCPGLKSSVNVIFLAPTNSLSLAWRTRLPRILGPTTTLIKSVPRNNGSVEKSPGWRWNSKFSTSRCANGLFGNGSLLSVRGGKNVKFFATWKNFCSKSTSSDGFRVSDEVRVGVERGKPVVALESAIISHGMPYPHNVETALLLQNIVRQQGAIPATIGVINGQLTVGLSDEEIISLGSPSKENDRIVIKVSRRDLPIALSQKMDGGTTVSGTIIGAVKAGIHIFATGGIGGVHRGAETSFDISADLRELGRNQIAVVSAGVKSILDIGKTLEYLETEGVCVGVLKMRKGKGRNNDSDVGSEMEIERDGNKLSKSEQIGRVKFPSFFTAESQFNAPYSLSDELQAAHLVNSLINFKLGSGILIAVPIPKEHEAGGQRIEESVKVALKKARELDIQGKDMTPFLLSEINIITGGTSLDANKCLVEHNVRTATQIAILLAELRKTAGKLHSYDDGGIGGSNVPKSYVTVDWNRSKNTDQDQGIRNATNISTTSSGNENIAANPGGNLLHKRDNQRFIDSKVTLNKLDSDLSIGLVNADVGENGNGWLRPRQGRPVIIGGSSMDLIMSVEEPEIVSDGRTHKSRIKTVAGGVGRNIAEALSKLGHDPVLISTIGDDLFGRELWRHFHQINMDTSKIFTISGTSTAIYSALLNHNGECVFGLGDMAIHHQMDAEVIREKCGQVIKDAGIVVMDGNLEIDVMTAVMSICLDHKIPVWFEPAEQRKAKKILKLPRELREAVRIISPNLKELASITEIDRAGDLSTNASSGTNNAFTFDLSQMQSLYEQCFSMFVGLELILFTRGKEGIQVVSRTGNGILSIISHPAPDLNEGEIKSVSGAGDCWNAGFISGILQGMSWSQCASSGTFCAKKSLQSVYNVPEQFY